MNKIGFKLNHKITFEEIFLFFYSTKIYKIPSHLINNILSSAYNMENVDLLMIEFENTYLVKSEEGLYKLKSFKYLKPSYVNTKSVCNIILKTLLKYFEKSWIEIIEYINDHKEIIVIAYKILKTSIDLYTVNNHVIELALALMENNNLNFHRQADYRIYDYCATYIYNLLSSKKYEIELTYKSKFYINSIHAKFVYTHQLKTREWEKILFRVLKNVRNSGDKIETIFCYISIAQFYSYCNNGRRSIEHLKKALHLIDDSMNINYKALVYFLYADNFNARFKQERAINFLKLIFELDESCITLQLKSLNLMADALRQTKKYHEAIDYSIKCYNKVIIHYGSCYEMIITESLITLAKCYDQLKIFSKAESHLIKALQIFKKIHNNSYFNPRQALVHEILGDLYVKMNMEEKGLNEYFFAEKILLSFYSNNFNKAKELSTIYLKITNVAQKIGDIGKYEDYMKLLY